MKLKRAKAIYREGKRIDGWFSQDAARLFAWIDEIQATHAITGDLFEIGCHHGKSAVMLAAMRRGVDETLGVCDLFARQADNVSGSGQGDLDRFNKNLARYARQGSAIVVHQCRSDKLKVADIGASFRFFHIDGGHNCDEALADLRLAAACLIPAGVIVLDDPFRSEWPGVTEAAIRFLDQHPQFRALMVGCNKLVLVHRDSQQLYADHFAMLRAREVFGFGYPWRLKPSPFHTDTLNILYIPDYRVANTPGNLLRRAYHKLNARWGERFDQLLGWVRPDNPIQKTGQAR